MKCLYCGKGIGPIRQLRDLEFCSEAHRTQFRERYRQQVYAALAPEPAPTTTADFIERPAVENGPSPVAALSALPKDLPAQTRPAVTADASGVGIPSAGCMIGDGSVANAQAARQAGLASRPQLIEGARFSVSIQPPRGGISGEIATNLNAGRGGDGVRLVAKRLAITLPTKDIAPPAAISPALPGPASAAAIALRAVLPAASTRGAGELRIAQSSAETGTGSGPAVTSPVLPAAPMLQSEPRPLEAGPRVAHCDLEAHLEHGVPVAFETVGTRNIAVSLPKLPAFSSSPSFAPALPLPAGPSAGNVFDPPLRPAYTVAHPAHDKARLSMTVVPWVDDQPGRMAPLRRVPDVQPSPMPHASLAADTVRRGAKSSAVPVVALGPEAQPPGVPQSNAIFEPSPLREQAGNRNPRSTPGALPPNTEVALPPQSMLALPPARLETQPFAAQTAIAPASPQAAAPSWNGSPVEARDAALVPRADIALPGIEWRPTPAGAIGRPDLPLPSNIVRSVRACGIFWTLRAAHLCNPVFGIVPVWVKLNELIRGDESLPYASEPQPTQPIKPKVRPIRREIPVRWRRPAIALVGIAAAVLLAVNVRPAIHSGGFGESLHIRSASIRQWMSERATRSFADDFRDGLKDWKGAQAKLPKSWSYSTDGFVHPGQLALYRPSVPLSDYRFEFMAQVESKSVDWVVRAHDPQNYYAMKFTVLEPGPRPVVAMVRYPVVQGVKGASVKTPLRMMIHANTPYRVSVDVKGNHYRAFVEGQEADFWTDDRLKTGGVGFFSETGEHARVYWVKLESHGDILGRICGLLAGKSGAGATDKENEAMDHRNAGTIQMKASTAPAPRKTEPARPRKRASAACCRRPPRCIWRASWMRLPGNW